MSPVRQRLRLLAKPNPVWLAVIAALALSTIGIAAIATVEPAFAFKQGRQWLPVSLIVMLLCILPHPRAIGLAAYPMLVGILALLVYLVVPGAPLVPRVNGATSWINLPGMSFQPAEVAKVVFVLAMAWHLRYRSSYRTLPGLLVPFAIMLIPVGLILKQPDLGTAILFAPTLFIMLVAAGAKLRHLGALIGVAAAVILINVAIIYVLPDNMQVLKPHQRARITSMISLATGDKTDLDTDAYHQDVAMRLIGAGGVSGYGYEQSRTLIRLNHLPHDHNDSIFAVIVNRWGLIGAWAVIGLYLLLSGSILAVASRSKDPFARLACVGFAAMIFVQAAINIGMFINLLPITGITLPFVSYGGSSLLATFAMIGLVINFATRRAAILTRPSFEFDKKAGAVFE